jgi:hypothetical protein
MKRDSLIKAYQETRVYGDEMEVPNPINLDFARRALEDRGLAYSETKKVYKIYGVE